MKASRHRPVRRTVNFCTPRRSDPRSAVVSWIPVQRSTTYKALQAFEQEPTEPEPGWNADRFGSYATLTASPEFRFQARR